MQVVGATTLKTIQTLKSEGMFSNPTKPNTKHITPVTIQSANIVNFTSKMNQVIR